MFVYDIIDVEAAIEVIKAGIYKTRAEAGAAGDSGKASMHAGLQLEKMVQFKAMIASLKERKDPPTEIVISVTERFYFTGALKGPKRMLV